MTGFAKRLTQLRESKDLKKNQLADILNVSDSCISQYESGRSMPGCDILVRIAQHFGVSVDYLLGNDCNDGFAPLMEGFSDGMDYAFFAMRCRKLPPEKRRLLLDLANALLEK